MNRKIHNHEPGYVAERRNPFRPTEKVAIYIAETQGIDVPDRYAVVCDAHGSIGSARSEKLARHDMKNPDEFCEDCRQLAATKLAKPGDAAASRRAEAVRALPADIHTDLRLAFAHGLGRALAEAGLGPVVSTEVIARASCTHLGGVAPTDKQIAEFVALGQAGHRQAREGSRSVYGEAMLTGDAGGETVPIPEGVKDPAAYLRGWHAVGRALGKRS